ncbi:sec1 family domain-containing 2 [Paramuricea clavata]|uniref:Sec1 family domain-containing 2 n=1 Tax=Paramuricea clavata TaxID=317549 RepID=A0A7D9DIS6_PARCT|nr:sec1 family domain-containing 2 [Paramuricea clavata]
MSNPKEPMVQGTIPSRPWEMVATDLFQWEQNNYLVVADYYSRYIEVVKLENTTSRTVVNHMKSIFARHGIPSVVRSDNGPQYTATEYKQFAQKWNFEHQTSSPYYPKSNGLAEKAVQIVKRDITDHFSQFCIFKSTKDKIEIPIKQQRRDFSQFSAVNFNNELSLTDWDEIFLKGDRDIDKTFCFIYKRINAILNKHAPIKLISRRQAKRLSKPWITKGIRTAIKHKNQLYADGKQSEYKIYRNRIQRLIRLSKANYYCEYFNKHLTNMKKNMGSN